MPVFVPFVLEPSPANIATVIDSCVLQLGSCLGGLYISHAITYVDDDSCWLPGCAGKLIVVFMHNLPCGHEKSMRRAGANNTDSGCWQRFSQHCHRIANMTFDETRWQWHDVNQAAAQDIIAAIKQLVQTHPDQTSADPSNVKVSC